MNLEEAIKRIEELERKVAELQARPPFPYPQAIPFPQPIFYPHPGYTVPPVWCGNWGAGVS